MVGTAPAGTGREVTVSLLSCSALGVIQWLVTGQNELLCYLREKVCHMWQWGKYFSAGTSHVSKDNQGAAVSL